MTMTTIQKLIRLREIELHLSETIHKPNYSGTREALYKERNTILATVTAPPMDLIGTNDPQAWAAVFAQQFGVDQDTAFVWCTHMMAAAEAPAYEEGLKVGKASVCNENLVKLLHQLREACDLGYIRANRLRVDGSEPQTVVQLITNTLKAEGFE